MAAALEGVLVSINPFLAFAFLVGLVAIPMAVLSPIIMAHLLLVVIYGQYFSIGGTTVQRLAAPLAGIAIAAQFFSAPVRLRRIGSVLAWVAVYSALAFASLTWTVSIPGTVDALGSLAIALAFMGAFALLIRGKKDIRALLWTNAISSLTLGLWWIVSFIVGIDRAANAAGDPNFNAMLMGVSIPLVVVLATTVEHRRTRISLYVTIAILGAAIISTLSRGGILAMVVGIFAVFAVRGPLLFPTRSQKRVLLVTSALGLLVVSVLAWSALSARFQEGFTQANRGSGRGDLWLAALHGYEEHPVGGIGFGAFRATSQQLLASTPGVNLVNFLHFSRLGGQEAHSAYLGSLVELGPLGLVLFLGIMVAAIRSLLRTARRAGLVDEHFIRSVALALGAGLLSFGVSSIFLSTETSGRPLWMIVGLSLALSSMIVPRHHHVSGESGEPQPATR